MEPEVGDKVKLKSHHGLPVRGIVEEVHGDELLVRLHESEELIAIESGAVTNFSLAARKAWKNMPHRRVGRPKGTSLRPSVRDATNRPSALGAVQTDVIKGRIRDRTATISLWFHEMLHKLERTQEHVDASENC